MAFLLLLLLFLLTLTQASESAVNADKISAAVRAAGYSTMSTILHKNQNLLQAVPYGKGITIFVPRDESLDGVEETQVELAHQIVPFKVDFDFFQNSCTAADDDRWSCVVELPTLNKKLKLRATGPGYGNDRFINNVRIVKWNVYKDGHVIVHGVQNLFPYGGDDWD